MSETKTKEQKKTSSSSKKKVQLEEGTYWFGLIEGCPVLQIGMAGKTFQKFTQNVTHDEQSGQTTRSEKPGQISFFSQEQCDRVSEQIETRFVREYGKGKRFIVMDMHRHDRKTGKKVLNPYGYNAESDVLVGKYMYMQKVEDPNAKVISVQGDPDTLL